MRWFFGFVAALVLLAIGYLGSAVYSLSTLAGAARAGDGAAVIAQTDIAALSRSLTDQIVAAYLERLGTNRRVSSIEKMLANTYGASIADAMVSKMITADKLTQLLKAGKLEAAPVSSAVKLPALADLPTGDVFGLLGRLNIIKPVLLGIRVSKEADPEHYAAIHLRFEGVGWKLAGIDLPKAVVRDLAATLPGK